MPFPNQFAISLKVAEMLPLPSTDKTTQNFISYARELANSGSDIVVEHDMLDIFGRSHISTWLASSFKTALRWSSSETQLWQVITLLAGPGPTVQRAFDESPYLTMIIQLSFLTWFFDAFHVAAALYGAMRIRLRGASPPMQKNLPSRAQILGLLKACERQTAAYNWNILYDNVRKSLQAPKGVHGDLHGEILTGALDMFPMVQILPKDRLVYIQLPVEQDNRSALCSLILWTHHILDLGVRVKQGRYRTTDHIFRGENGEQIIIEEVSSRDQPSITLLDASKESLFKVEPGPFVDVPLVSALNRINAKEWGKRFLLGSRKALGYTEPEYHAVLRKLQIVSCSFAQIVAAHLMRDGIWERVAGKGGSVKRIDVPCHTDPEKIRKAANIVFNNPEITEITQLEINDMNDLQKNLISRDNLPISATLYATARRRRVHDQDLEDIWSRLGCRIRYLSVYLIAFAHIQNLADFKELFFCSLGDEDIKNHELARQLEDWNGKSQLYVGDATWLQAIAVLLLAHSRDVWELPWDRVCLISDRGWSAWILTFEIVDPECMNVGDVFIGRGSPCMNGSWKEGVWDAPSSDLTFSTDVDPNVVKRSGESAFLTCTEPVSFETPYCWDEDKVFLIYARLRRSSLPWNKSIVKIGFRVLHEALWYALPTDSCSHGISPRNAEISLPMSCVTVDGHGSGLYDVDEKVIACLTAENQGARWLGLASFRWTSIFSSGGEIVDNVTKVCMLRRSNCCFRCALDQAMMKEHRLFLVL